MNKTYVYVEEREAPVPYLTYKKCGHTAFVHTENFPHLHDFVIKCNNVDRVLIDLENKIFNLVQDAESPARIEMKVRAILDNYKIVEIFVPKVFVVEFDGYCECFGMNLGKDLANFYVEESAVIVNALFTACMDRFMDPDQLIGILNKTFPDKWASYE